MDGRRPAVLVVLPVGILLFLSSCSTGPPSAKMGTPEWHWNAANEQSVAGDLTKTQEHLEKVLLSDNPFRARATIWHLVMSGGMALGYKELAEAYDAGGSQTKTQAGEFRRRATDMNRLSRQYCIALAQELDRFQKEASGANEFSLDFSFPHGSANEDPAIGRIRKGILPPEEERTKAERFTIARGVLLETGAVVGTGEDAAKTFAVFQTKPVKVPKAVFLYGLAENLVETAKIFDRKRLNEPDKKKILLQLALDCLKPAEQADDAALKKKAKSLGGKIAKEQKAGSKA